MNMLKKIYSEGDDEMKRTINKAWSESQEKKMQGEGMMDLWAPLTDLRQMGTQPKDTFGMMQI